MASPKDYNVTTYSKVPWSQTEFDSKGVVVSYASGVSDGGYSQLARVGNVTPNWRALIRKRLVKPDLPYFIREFYCVGSTPGDSQMYRTSMSIFRYIDTTIYFPDGTWSKQGYPKLRIQRDGRADWYGPASMVLPSSIAAHESAARSRAITKMLMRLKDSKFNAAVAYNEAGQVHRLIGDSARKIAKALVDLRHGHLRLAMEGFGLSVSKRAAARYRKAMNRAADKDSIDTVLAQGVLMVQYGIRPLMSDVVGAAELFAQKVTPEAAADLRTSSTVFINEKQAATASGSLAFPEEFWNGSFSAITTGSVRVSCKIQYTRGNETLHTLSQLGLTNPALVVWEAVPWSFVIDWFLPVGNWISSLDATLGLSFKSGCISTQREYTHARSQAVAGYVVTSNSVTTKERQFTREILSGFPSPSLPSFKNPASLEHALNGIALLVGLRNKIYDAPISDVKQSRKPKDYLWSLNPVR